MEAIKRLGLYTDDELVLMNDEQLEDLIKTECMCDGVVTEYFKPEPVKIPSIPLRDKKIYSFSFSVCDESESIEMEKRINELKSLCKCDYDYSVGSEYKYVAAKSAEEIVPSVINVYSEESYKNIKPTLMTIKNLKDTYEDLACEYDEKSEDYAEIRSKVMERYYQASNNKSKLDRAVSMYQEYLRLSNGSSEIAENFFKQSVYASLFDEVIKAI